MKIIEKNIPDELLKTGYWLRLSPYFTFIITLEIKEDTYVKAIAYEVNYNYLDIEDIEIENGEAVLFYQCDDWWIELDIWGKYYFPKFNEEKNQWYHKYHEKDHDYITDFCELLKQTYKIAMDISKLKIY
jgi:hypothetical protein